MQSGNSASAMRLGDYVGLLRRQWLPVLLCLLLGVGAALAYVQWAPKEYRSQTSVLVTPTTPDAATDRSAAINLDTEAQLVTSTETVAAAAELLADDGGEARDLADRVNGHRPAEHRDPRHHLHRRHGGGGAGRSPGPSPRPTSTSARRPPRPPCRPSTTRCRPASTRCRSSSTRPVASAGQACPPGSSEAARNERQVAALNDQLAALGSQQNRSAPTAVRPGRIVTEARAAHARPAAPTCSSPSLPVHPARPGRRRRRRRRCGTAPTTSSAPPRTSTAAPACRWRRARPTRCTTAR